MTNAIVMAYSWGWMLTTVTLLVASHLLRNDKRPARYVLALSIAAGAVWPLLLFGAVQYGLAALLLCVVERRSRFSGSHSAKLPSLPGQHTSSKPLLSVTCHAS